MASALCTGCFGLNAALMSGSYHNGFWACLPVFCNHQACTRASKLFARRNNRDAVRLTGLALLLWLKRACNNDLSMVNCLWLDKIKRAKPVSSRSAVVMLA